MTPEQTDRNLLFALDNLEWLTTDGRLNPRALELIERHRLASQPVPAPDLVERAAEIWNDGVNGDGAWSRFSPELQKSEREYMRDFLSAVIPIIQAEEREECAKVADEWEATLRPGKGVKEMAKWIATAIRERNGG